jgi:hypothetical protein
MRPLLRCRNAATRDHGMASHERDRRGPARRRAARYVSGSVAVGGDWYDVFTLPGGELGVVIGDVTGWGLSPR